MGHGDEIVFADANFPTVSTGKRIVRADGIGAVELLDAVLQLFPLDQYDEDHFVLMEVVPEIRFRRRSGMSIKRF